jgi:hypothetical protein
MGIRPTLCLSIEVEGLLTVFDYGDRSNRWLLLLYTFCMEDNCFDSYEVYLKKNPNSKRLSAKDIVSFKFFGEGVRLRLKLD